MTGRRARPPRRGGFTLVEMACAAVLTGLMGVLCLIAWKAFGVPAVDSYHRGRMAGEAALAAASLAADLGGALPPAPGPGPLPPEGPVGGRDDRRLVDWQSAPGSLELWYDGGPADPGEWSPPSSTSHVITYAVHADAGTGRRTLRRHDSRAGSSTVVAADVASMQALILPGVEERLVLTLEFQYRLADRVHSRTYTFEALKP